MSKENVDSMFHFLPEDPRDFNEEPEEPQKKKTWPYVARGIVALLILGLVYMYGIQQALFYQRTPQGVSQRETESVLDAETITIPVNIFVLTNNEDFGSERSEEDITQIVANASKILNQADIDLRINEIVFLEMSDDEIGELLSNPSRNVNKIEKYDPNAINAFLSRTLKGIHGVNGIAFTGIRTIAVADFTTVYDFRVFAHEVGHVLGLDHTNDSRNRLMYRGANGLELTAEEVLRAREFASEFVVK